MGSLAVIVSQTLSVLARNVGSRPNGIKLGRAHEILLGISLMLGVSTHFLYVWVNRNLLTMACRKM